MKVKFLFFTFTLFFISNILQAKCLKDIWTAGVAFDSVAYTLRPLSLDEALLTSDTAIRFKGTWLFSCPKKNFEIQSYVKLRQYSFKSSTVDLYWKDISETRSLPSLGSEFRLFKKWWKHAVEIPIILEVRKEIRFDIDFENTTVNQSDYYNLMLASGIRYNTWKSSFQDIYLIAKFGALYSFAKDIKFGFTYSVATNYYHKFAKRFALGVEVYYEYYQQEQKDLELNYAVLGVMSNLVFRF